MAEVLLWTSGASAVTTTESETEPSYSLQSIARDAPVDTVNCWLSGRLHEGEAEIGRLARLAEASERINAAARDAETYNLERKPFVFGVFGLLAEATRG